MKLFNYERNADLLAGLSLFIKHQDPQIFSINLVAFTYDTNQYINRLIDINSELILDERNLLNEHPETPSRIAFSLELSEKLEAAMENLLNSYRLTNTH
jgi:hypothetical protein